MTPLTFISLFAGIGGLDLGLERAGMRCVAQVEIDDYATKVLAKHWPDVARFRDVRTVGAHNLPHARAVVGGFPCDQTSTGAAVHGRRVGLDGDLSGLWYEQLRITRELDADYALVENVGGVLTWDAQITGGLEDAGFRVSRAVVTAADFGAPHLRRRVFYVAYRDCAGLPFAWPPRPSEITGNTGRAAARDAWLSALAGVCRVDDGLPAGVDPHRRERITALGKAVVPAMAEYVGRAIVAHAAALDQREAA